MANDTTVIQHYDLLVRRAMHEGTLFWVRFSAFFVVISATFAGYWATVGKCAPEQSLLVIVGLTTSIIWVLAMINGRNWVRAFDKLAYQFEGAHAEALGAGRIGEAIAKTDSRLNVVNLAIALAGISTIAWSCLLFMSHYFPCVAFAD